MPRFKFVHPRAIQYTNPSFVAVPGETYELDKAPDDLHWQKARANSNAKEE